MLVQSTEFWNKLGLNELNFELIALNASSSRIKSDRSLFELCTTLSFIYYK